MKLHEGKVILSFNGMLTREQAAEVRDWWSNPTVRAAYLANGNAAPNRLLGAYINEDGDAV